MIKTNITLVIAAIIGFTCAQSMHASDNELAIPEQQTSPYNQARETQLKRIIHEKIEQWYNTEHICMDCNTPVKVARKEKDELAQLLRFPTH